MASGTDSSMGSTNTGTPNIEGQVDHNGEDGGFGDSDLEDGHQLKPVKAFLFPKVRPCPFVALGQCKHPGFEKQRALSSHCRQKQVDANKKPIIITSVEEDPVEDGTMKIPCRWKCSLMFSSYHAANDHAQKAKKECERSEADVYPRLCPWSQVAGTMCVHPPSASARAESAHCTQAHATDVRDPYQCHLCDDYYADLYALRSHVNGCGKGLDSGRSASQRVIVGDQSQKPTVLIVARASGGFAPRSWFQGHELLQDGIILYADRLVAEFVADLALEDHAVVFQAILSARTRHIPTERLNTAFTVHDAMQRRFLNNAWKFTNRVETDLIMISGHCKPTVVSVGLDGFCCQASNLVSFLQRNAPFTLIIRETELVHGMKEDFFPRCDSGLHCRVFESMLCSTSELCSVQSHRTDDGFKPVAWCSSRYTWLGNATGQTLISSNPAAVSAHFIERPTYYLLTDIL